MYIKVKVILNTPNVEQLLLFTTIISNGLLGTTICKTQKKYCVVSAFWGAQKIISEAFRIKLSESEYTFDIISDKIQELF